MPALFGLGLELLRQFVPNVDRLVHPAALLLAGGPYPFQRRPKAEGTVGDGQFRRDGIGYSLNAEKCG